MLLFLMLEGFCFTQFICFVDAKFHIEAEQPSSHLCHKSLFSLLFPEQGPGDAVYKSSCPLRPSVLSN